MRTIVEASSIVRPLVSGASARAETLSGAVSPSGPRGTGRLVAPAGFGAGRDVGPVAGALFGVSADVGVVGATRTAAPSPLTGTLSAPPGALEAIVTLAVLAPPPCGANLTSTVQCAPGASL